MFSYERLSTCFIIKRSWVRIPTLFTALVLSLSLSIVSFQEVQQLSFFHLSFSCVAWGKPNEQLINKKKSSHSEASVSQTGPGFAALLHFWKFRTFARIYDCLCFSFQVDSRSWLSAIYHEVVVDRCYHQL